MYPKTKVESREWSYYIDLVFRLFATIPTELRLLQTIKFFFTMVSGSQEADSAEFTLSFKGLALCIILTCQTSILCYHYCHFLNSVFYGTWDNGGVK